MSEHPRRYTVPAELRSGDDLYMTPGWLIRLWVARHKPSMPGRVIDPCAGDGRIGRAFRAFQMFDLTPRNEAVERLDFLELIRENFGGVDVSVVMNPPFTLAREFLEKGLELAGDDGDVAMIMRPGCMQQAGWTHRPVRAFLPKRRVQFEITAEYAAFLTAEAARRGKKPSHSREDCPTGWKLGSPGDDHGIFVFRNGWNEPTETHYIDAGPFLEVEGDTRSG